MTSAVRLCICGILVIILAQIAAESKAFSEDATPISRSNYPLLSDISTLSVHIDISSNLVETDKSFLDKLTKLIEGKLQKAGFKILNTGQGDSGQSTAGTSIDLNIELLKIETAGQLVCRTQTSLHRPVVIEQPARLNYIMQVWRSKSLMQVIPLQDAQSKINESAINQIDEFCSTVKPSQSVTSQKPAKQTSSNTTEKPNTPSQSQQVSNYPFAASKNSEIFHKSTCPSAKRIAVGNLVNYNTRQQAIDAGKRPCMRCKP